LRVNVLKKHIDSFKFLHLIPPAFVLVLVFGVLLGFINKVFFTILGLLLAFYFILNISASIKAVFPNKIKYFLFIPFLVFILHISWGLGFLVGMFLPKSQKY
jgi:hypothetical protein